MTRYSISLLTVCILFCLSVFHIKATTSNVVEYDFSQETSVASQKRILILSVVHTEKDTLQRFFDMINSLTYPKSLISLGFAALGSTQSTKTLLDSYLNAEQYERVTYINLPANSYDETARNFLTTSTLTDHDAVVWLDSNVQHVGKDMIEAMIKLNKDCLVPRLFFPDNKPANSFSASPYGGISSGDPDADLAYSLDTVSEISPFVVFLKGNLLRSGAVYSNPAQSAAFLKKNLAQTIGTMGGTCYGVRNLVAFITYRPVYDVAPGVFDQGLLGLNGDAHPSAAKRFLLEGHDQKRRAQSGFSPWGRTN